MVTRAYLRVSTLEQATGGTSLTGQREEIARYADGRDVVWYVDTESGAGKGGEDRVEQRRLLADLQPGDVVVVSKQDRWSRDTRFFLSSVDDEIVAKGARFFALAERFDPSTPEGRLTSTIMSAVAEQERRRILDRTEGARALIRSRGEWGYGTRPLGYAIVNRRPVVIEAEAEIVRRMFALALTHSAVDVGRRIGLEYPGTTGLDRGNIARRLRDRRYLGESPTEKAPGPEGKRRRWAGWTKTHEAIVDAQTWHAVQDALSSRLRAGRRPGEASASARFLLRSLVRCAVCGFVVDCRGQTEELPRHRDYYDCHRCSIRARRDASDAAIEAGVPVRLAQLSARLAKASPARQEAAPDFAAARARLLAKRARLVAAVADGAIPLDQVRALREAIDAEVSRVDADAAAYAARVRPVSRSECLARVEEITGRWGAATLAERREIVRLLTERITLQRDGEARKWARGSTVVVPVWKKCG